MAKRYRLGEWDGPSNYSSGYTFTKKPTPEDLAWKLLEYIELCEYAGVHATKKEFLLVFLGKKLRKDQLTGYLSSLFGSVQDAGIVNRIRSRRLHFYVKGINADHYRNGTLRLNKPKPRRISVPVPNRLPNATRTFTDVRILPGSYVIMVPASGVPLVDLAEDIKHAEKDGQYGFDHFLKRLVDPVDFDQDDVICAPWKFYEQSNFRTHEFGFDVKGRWGRKWKSMFVKKVDIIER